MDWGNGDSDADCDVAGGNRAEFVATDALAQTVGAEGSRVFNGVIFGKNTEFIASDAANNICFAEFLAKQSAELPQDLVSGDVALNVIDIFETVNIQHHEDLISDAAFICKPVIDLIF